jgi:hypothetical protein
VRCYVSGDQPDIVDRSPPISDRGLTRGDIIFIDEPPMSESEGVCTPAALSISRRPVVPARLTYSRQLAPKPLRKRVFGISTYPGSSGYVFRRLLRDY